jgi:hypothetical protein
MHSLTSSDEEGAQSSHPLGLATSEVPEELGNDTDLNESFELGNDTELKESSEENVL